MNASPHKKKRAAVRRIRRNYLDVCIGMALLSTGLAVTSTVVAQSKWQGQYSSDILNSSNWINSSGNPGYDYNGMYIGKGVNYNAEFVFDSSPYSQINFEEPFFHVGYQHNDYGTFNISATQRTEYGRNGMFYLDAGSFSVGTGGGQGALNMVSEAGQYSGSFELYMNSANYSGPDNYAAAGYGAGSYGLLNIRGYGNVHGYGKYDYEFYNKTYFSLSGGMLYLGYDNGTGELILDNAGFYNPVASYATGHNLIIGGKGGAGIATLSNGSELWIGGSGIGGGTAATATVLGLDGGTATIHLSGSNELGVRTGAYFTSGLIVGGPQGTATVTVEDGAQVFAAYQKILPATASRSDFFNHIVGTDSGTGDVVIRGADSVVQVAGNTGNASKRYIYTDSSQNSYQQVDVDAPAASRAGGLDVGVGGTGSITLSDGGSLSFGTAYLGAEYDYRNPDATTDEQRERYMLLNYVEGGGILNLGSGGSVSIGAKKTQTAVLPGFITGAGNVNFLASTAELVLNHTATDYVLSPTLAGSGLITVQSGTTTLTGDSPGFAGAVTLSGGQLWVNGTLGTATNGLSLDASTGSALGGAGKIGGNVTIGNGASLLPGLNDHAVGVLAIGGNLSLSPGATTRFLLGEEGLPGGAFNDLVTVSGDLVIDGNLVVEQAPGGEITHGIYQLFHYDGQLERRNMVIGSLPSSIGSATLQTSIANEVNLVVNSPGVNLQFWDGELGPYNNGVINGGNGVWQNDQGNDAWTFVDGAPNVPFITDAFAIFSATPGNIKIDTALGDVRASGLQFSSSGYAIQGGALTLTGQEAIIRAGQSRSVTSGNEFIATIDSVIAGDVLLKKLDTGVLVLGGRNTYTGGTYIDDGIIQIVTDAGLGAAGTAVTFQNGGLRTSADLTLSRPVVIEASAHLQPMAGTTLILDTNVSGTGRLFKEHTGTLVLTGSNTQTGGTYIGAGILQIAADTGLGAAGTPLGFGDGSLRTTADLQINRAVAIDTAATFLPAAGTRLYLSGDLSGNGTLSVQNADAFVFSGNGAAFTGQARISNSLFTVNGNLSNAATVISNAGRISGNGAVGDLALESGTSISPGNSIGRLTVDGNYRQAAGATYEWELQAGSSSADHVRVNGQAVLDQGARLAVTRLGNQPFALDQRYTVLSSTGLSGQFILDGQLAISPFLSLAAVYDANSAYVEVAQTRAITDIPCSSNNRAVASAIGHLDRNNPLQLALLNHQSMSDLCDSLGQLSGEVYASSAAAMLSDSRFLRESVSRRLAQADAIRGEGTAVWTEVFGSWGHLNKGRDHQRLNRDVQGAFAGVDVAVADGTTVGLVTGFSRSHHKIKRWQHGNKGHDAYLGLYASHDWDNGYAISGGLAQGWHSQKTMRHLQFDHYRDHHASKYDARTQQAFAEISRQFDLDQLRLQPYANVAYVHLKTDAFTENGGLAALSALKSSHHVTFSNLGVRGDYTLGLTARQTPIRLTGGAGWRHASGDRRVAMPFSVASGEVFTITGVPVSANSAHVELGIEGQPNDRLTLGLRYEGLMGGGVSDYGAKAYVDWRF